MRRVACSVGRGVSVVVLSVVLAGSAFGAPQERDGEFREKQQPSPIVKVVKKVVRAFGDLLTIPTPAPRP
ncbi:MAG TPA: hypothetical protein VEK57_13255 [Thermoanaerobaculia bacterium]|nr:hypothetical protein [Thermoanaerobaculia bacterium]